MKTAIIQEPVDVSNRLARLSLTIEPCCEAVKMGEAARSSCTANDPATTPGYLAWARTTRGLRELLAALGWRRQVEGGLETVVSPDGCVAIVVATGDEATGRSASNPRTKYVRGPATVAAIEQNQLSLSFIEPAAQAPAQSLPDRVTWLLLTFRGTDEVRYELSLPKAVGEDGRVESWAERIIFEPLRLDPTPVAAPVVDQGADIVVEVSRRVR